MTLEPKPRSPSCKRFLDSNLREDGSVAVMDVSWLMRSPIWTNRKPTNKRPGSASLALHLDLSISGHITSIHPQRAGMSVLASSLLGLAREHVTAARTQAGLVRALEQNGVLRSPRASRALSRVDRALFLPKDAPYMEPYENRPLSLGVAHAMLSTPYHHALVVSLLERKLMPGARVCDLGCGSGYLVAVFADLVVNDATAVACSKGFVMGVERAGELVELSKNCLEACPVSHGMVGSGRVRVVERYLHEEGKDYLGILDKKFDVINVGYGIAEDDKEELERLLSMLSPNGGMMLCPILVDKETQTQYLFTFNKDFETPGKVRKDRVDIGPVAVSGKQEGRYQRQNPAELEAKLKAKLESWKSQFAKNHNRNPSREDIAKDPVASELFQEFSKLRQRKW